MNKREPAIAEKTVARGIMETADGRGVLARSGDRHAETVEVFHRAFIHAKRRILRPSGAISGRVLIALELHRTFCHLYLAKVRVHHLGHARSGGTAGLENQNDFTRSVLSGCRSEGSSARAVSYGGRPHRRTIIKSQYPQRTISPPRAKGPRTRR